MSAFRRKFIFLTACCGLLLSVSLPAQPVANGVPLSTPPSTLKSPVAAFRELLAMNPDERKSALSIRPPQIQQRIIEKLQEYEILPPEIREQRLRETELRWYLLPLMSLPRTNRAARLAMIPEEQRELVQERLERWDLLPPDLQEDLLNSEVTANYFSQLRSAATAEQRANILSRISPERRAELQAGLDRWQKYSEQQRQQMLDGFGRFFELTPKEKEQALDTLSEAERSQMESTLDAYAKLTPDQRAQCLRSFEKFASMSVPERQLFLQNAERWKEMSPSERAAWRQLVNVAPIMPLNANPPPAAPNASPSVATN